MRTDTIDALAHLLQQTNELVPSMRHVGWGHTFEPWKVRRQAEEQIAQLGHAPRTVTINGITGYASLEDFVNAQR